MQQTEQSAVLFEEARQLIPGGVDSPVRAFRSVGGVPRFIERGSGAHIWDVDGNRYVDYVLSWGPLVLGHAPAEVVSALRQQATLGTSFGAPTRLEVELARLVTETVPAVEQVRFVNSGTEATMSALRLARAFTQRDKFIKMSGHYHGHGDLLLVQAGSGVATLGLPDSPGVPASTTAGTLTAPFNDLAAIEGLFQKFPGQIAAIIVEPVSGNMGVVPPRPGYLEGLRSLTEQHGALLILDEVMTGFRVARGGAQELYGIRPDLTTLGKVIGGGLPVGAYGGRGDIMRLVAPEGPVYQAGTLSGNPLAMTAGLATLHTWLAPGIFERAAQAAVVLEAGLQQAAKSAGIPLQTARAGTMLGFFFNDAPVVDYESAKRSDTDRYAKFFHAALEEGVYFAPSQFEAAFLSTAHTPDIIETTLAALRRVFRDLATRSERS